MLAILELGYSVLTLRFSHARDVVLSWVSTVLRVGTLWKARRQVASTRQIRDREIRRRQAPGSTRLKSFLQGQIGGEVALRAISGCVGRTAQSGHFLVLADDGNCCWYPPPFEPGGPRLWPIWGLS